jgi:hypothetical protein
MARLFGFSIEDNNKKLSKNIISPVPPNNDDGSDHYLTTGFFSSYVDVEGVYRTEFDLIRRYREMALHHEVDSAIEDIVNEAIVSDTNDSPIEIELSNLNASDGIKNTIRQEFKTILEMLDFDKKSHEIFRNWYIDGRLYYHKLIDFKDPHAGIQDIRYVDAMKIRYVRQAKKQKRDILGPKMYGDQGPNEQVFPDLEEYFVYNPKQTYPVGAADISAGAEKGIKFTKESIAYCTSGLVDRNKGTSLSYLNKAIKILNQLRMIEDSIVIYRLSRSSEKRIFYIDVGNLPKPKAEQFLREQMMKYRNKMNYNNLTGEVDTSRKFMSLMEDFWFPRREGGRGTEVTTLPAGCLSMDTKVSLLDGRELTISEIESEMKNGKKLWTYSCHPSTGEFAPGLISWAGVTQKNAKVMKITLDNGESIVCTYDHKFPIYDLGFVEAKDLVVGQSMIPLKKESDIYISSIDYLTNEIEVGTLTIDSDESIHNYHTFALSCGVYTKNSNLGELTDLDYFKRNLYKSLNVPETRIGGDSGFNLGRSTEILRDEVKFTKFVGRLRKRFSQLFIDLLKTQLLLKNIVTPEDWKKMAEHIQFDFLYDNHFAELKESELFTERLNMASMAAPYVGKYFSQDYLRRKILRQTDEEIIEQDEIMAKEIEDGIIPDPNAPIDPQTGLPLDQTGIPNGAPGGATGAPGGATGAPESGNNINGQSGKVPVEPDVKPKEPKMPKGGEI